MLYHSQTTKAFLSKNQVNKHTTGDLSQANFNKYLAGDLSQAKLFKVYKRNSNRYD